MGYGSDHYIDRIERGVPEDPDPDSERVYAEMVAEWRQAKGHPEGREPTTREWIEWCREPGQSHPYAHHDDDLPY